MAASPSSFDSPRRSSGQVDLAQHALVLYDGHCALCSGAVQTILRLDDQGAFRFAPLQSDLGKDLLARHQLNPATLDSVVLIDGSSAFTKSDAFFRIAHRLGWPYRAFQAFQVLPKGLRNSLYDWVARNRYRVFGTHEACWLPKTEWRGRFLAEE